MKQCFDIWIANDTKILVIGTMPSEISIAKNMYYANPQNKFWKYIYKIFNQNEIPEDKQTRKQFLLSNHIGLWDALARCEREGSLDSNIKQEIPNDFSQYKQIQYYFFNGQKAFYFFKKYNGNLLKENNYIVLPSTSPANASMKDEIKFKIWYDAFHNKIKTMYLKNKQLYKHCI